MLGWSYTRGGLCCRCGGGAAPGYQRQPPPSVLLPVRRWLSLQLQQVCLRCRERRTVWRSLRQCMRRGRGLRYGSSVSIRCTSPTIVKNLRPNSRTVSTNPTAFNPTASTRLTVPGGQLRPLLVPDRPDGLLQQADIVGEPHRQRLVGSRPRALGRCRLVRERHELAAQCPPGGTPPPVSPAPAPLPAAGAPESR